MNSFTDSVNPTIAKYGYEVVKTVGNGYHFYFSPLNSSKPELYNTDLFGMYVLLMTVEQVETELLRRIQTTYTTQAFITAVDNKLKGVDS